MLLLDVPSEILVVLVDFLQTHRPLSQTCQRAWRLLRGRYARYWVQQENVQAVAVSPSFYICPTTALEMLGLNPLPV